MDLSGILLKPFKRLHLVDAMTCMSHDAQAT